MGETTNPVSHATVAPDPMQMDDPDAIRAEIEATRAQMGATIDEIQHRFSPEHLKEQAQEVIYDATVGKVENLASNAQDEVRNMGNSLMQTIKDNPMPAAIAGFGLAWLFASGNNNSPQQQTRYGTPYRPNPPQNYAYQAQSELRRTQNRAQSTLNEWQTNASETASQVQDQVQDLAQDAQAKAQQAASQAQRQLEEAQYQAQYAAQQAHNAFYNQVEQNPLLIGALAMGAGALIGMSLPTTQLENRYLGEYSDSMMEQVQQTAGQVTEHVKEAAVQVKDVAAETLQTSAEERNLSDSDDAEEALRKTMRVTLDVKDAVLDEAETQAEKRQR